MFFHVCLEYLLRLNFIFCEFPGLCWSLGEWAELKIKLNSAELEPKIGLTLAITYMSTQLLKQFNFLKISCYRLNHLYTTCNQYVLKISLSFSGVQHINGVLQLSLCGRANCVEYHQILIIIFWSEQTFKDKKI